MNIVKIANKFNKLLKSIKLSLVRDKKVYILIFLIIFVGIIIYILLYNLKFSVYEPVDHKNKVIVFGETCDLTNNDTSINYSLGYQLAFDYINMNGGINGYILKIILLNDKYETNLSIDNAKLLIDYYNVLALIGTFGTPTYIGIKENVIKERPIPLIGPYTSSEVIREKFDKHTIFMTSSVVGEVDIITNSLLQNSFNNISVIYQNDSYGILSYNALLSYILTKNYNLNIISSGMYERNSMDLSKCFESVFNSKSAYNYGNYSQNNTNKIQAIIIFAAEKQISFILGNLKKIKPSIAIYYIYFAGTRESNVKYLKDLNKDNVYQSVLSLTSFDKYPILDEMLTQIINIYNKKNKVPITYKSSSLIQGFYIGLMIGEVLKQFKDINLINRETLIDMIYKMKYIDIYGLKIGPFELNKSNEGLRDVSLNKLQPNNTYKTIDTFIYDRNKKNTIKDTNRNTNKK